MFLRIVIYLGLAVTASCTTAKMAMDPGLELDSDRFPITQRPVAFSGSDLVFGPYRASRIDRSFVSGSSESVLGFTSKNVEQDFRYHFKGQRDWKGECVVASGNLEYKIVSGGYFADIHCRFAAMDNSTAVWNFEISGETSGTAHGRFKIGSKTFEVKAINKIEGSSLRLSQHSGYYFYSHGDIVAGVDTISREGAVWINRNLSEVEKDAIALVAIALLLNQT